MAPVLCHDVPFPERRLKSHLLRVRPEPARDFGGDFGRLDALPGDVRYAGFYVDLARGGVVVLLYRPGWPVVPEGQEPPPLGGPGEEEVR